MALIKWGDDEDQQKEDDIFNPTPVKQVASVQGGSWQPAPSGADNSINDDSVPQQENGGIFNQQPQQTADPQPQNDNYLLSDEKSQIDEQKRQRDIEIEQARIEQANARQRAAAAAAAAEQFEDGNVQDQQGQRLNVDALKKDNNWKRYYDSEFKRERDGLDFWGRLMDGGQASKRAEVSARGRYASELINRAYDEDGNVRDPNAALQARGVTAYNSAMARDNVTRSEALARSIGATRDNQGGGIMGRLKNTINAEKQMSIYDALFGADDGTKFTMNDVGRFGGGLVQGFGTMPVIGAKEIVEAGRGRGTNYETGFEEDLNGLERGGRAVSGALNTITPFVGGSGKLLESLTTKVLRNTATAAEKTLLKRMTSQVLMPAIEQGGIGAAQAGGEYFGNGNTLFDENGDFDKDKLLEFARQTGEAGAMGFAGGAVMSGGAVGINRLRNSQTPILDAAELAELELNNTNAGTAQLADLRTTENPGQTLQALESGQLTPVEQPTVADGVAEPLDELTPIAPEDRIAAEQAADGVAAVDAPAADTPTVDTPAMAEPELTPVGALTADMLPEGTPTSTADTPNQLINPDSTAPAALDADGIATPDVPPAEMTPTDVTPVTDKTVPQADVPAPVADGVPLDNVVPVRGDMPAGERVRDLQESRAGTNQAEEAAINQQLQETQNTPAYMRRAPQTVGAADAQYKLTGESTLPDTVFSADSRTDPMSGADATDTPAFYRRNADEKIPELTEKIGALDKRIALLRRATDQVISFQDKQRIAEAYKVSRELGERMREHVANKNRSSDNQRVLKEALVERNQLANERSRYQAAKEQGLPERQQELTPVKDVPQVDSVPPAAAEPTNTAESSLPDDMNTQDASTDADGVPLTREQVAERFMPKLDGSKDTKQQIADAVGMSKDVESPVREVLKEGNVKPKQAERVATLFDKFDEQLQEYNKLTDTNRKGYADEGVDGVSEDISKQNRRAGRELGITTRRLMQEIKRLELKGDRKAQLVNGLINAIGTRNANVLTSAGLLERNVFQELTSNVRDFVKNPIKVTKSTFTQGNILKDTAKAELSHWGDTPRTLTESVKYLVGNTYRTAMIPTTALANTRRGAIREELTRWAFKELEGRDLSSAEARKLAGTAGNEMEALVNTGIGVNNGMTNRGQFTEALKGWKEYMRQGDDGARADYLKHVEEHSSLADQMIAGLSKEDQTHARGLKAMGNLIFPFVRTATNLMKTTVQQDLNPFAKSIIDEIRADQRGNTANAVNLIKSKLVDYGIMGGAAALASAGVLAYNDGDEIDKPRGWSLKIDDNRYVPVRATSLELPLALAGTAFSMSRDISEGKAREWQHYAGMVTGSLPYIDQMNTTTGAVDSLMSGEDGGYAAKAYGVNMAKSFVPGTNNGIQPYVAGKQGESLNAKKVYDADLKTWLTNTIYKSYDPNFYNGLKDSRDNAGRVRTVDNQGVISHKNINDVSTAEFNDRITDLVDYGREAGLGKNTQDMFNTYDTGKNNNFKSIHDAITFLDAPTMNGKSTPDDTKKLEKNGKLVDLSQQIREGFFGETGDELLTLNGQNLKSDVSMPNTVGTKNSKMPISMQSIKNAIAQTDLPEEEGTKLYEISQESDKLWDAFKNQKAITYEQYRAAKDELGQQEVDILSNSENYKKMVGLFDELDESGFFKPDGLGATRSGQTYLWNSLNALLGSKGATPATKYPENDKNKGFTPWGRGGGRGTGRNATNKPGDRGNTGIKWTPAGRRQMAGVQAATYTPLSVKVKLGSQIKKDRSQNYSDRSF